MTNLPPRQEYTQAKRNDVENRLIEASYTTLKEPVSVIISFDNVVEKDKIDYTPDLIDWLKRNGVKCAAEDDKEAADPSYAVVTKTGIRTPFSNPEMAYLTAKEMGKLVEIMPKLKVNDDGVENYRSVLKVKGNFSCQTIDQMTDPIKENQKKQDYLGSSFYHPNPEKADEILARRGQNFVDDFLSKALEKVSEDTLVIDNKLLYSGCNHPIPHLVAQENESKAYTYGSIMKMVADGYPQVNGDYPLKKINSYDVVFMKTYLNKENATYLDFGSEQGQLPLKDGKGPESIIFPHRNELQDIFIHFRSGDEHKYFKLDPKNPEHADFIELGRPAYNPPNEYMLQRRREQKRQAEQNGGKPKVYDCLQNSQSLLAEQILKKRGIILNQLKRQVPQEKEKQITETQEKAHPQKKSAFGKLMRVLSGRISRKTKKAIRKITNSNVRPDLNRGGRS